MQDGRAKRPVETLEAKTRTRARRDSIRHALLATIALVGALPVAMAAPKVLELLADDKFGGFLPQNPKQRLQETASRLKRKGLIEFRAEGGKKRMHLTTRGKEELGRMHSRGLSVPRPRKWDRRWRIVIFDIPEKRHSLRARIRTLIHRLGFIRLQDSVWVYPYDCEEIITLLKTELKVGRDVLYLIADAIEFDRPLREKFKLPLID